MGKPKPRIFGVGGKPATEAYERRFADLRAASREVGDTNSSRLAWIVRFAVQPDVAQWHSAALASAGDGLLAIGGHAVPSNCLGGVRLPPSLSREQVVGLHSDLSRVLRAVVSATAEDGAPIIATGPMEVGILRLTAIGQKPARFGLVYGDSAPREAVLHRLKEMILESGGHLIACRLCESPFLANRKQQFCTPQCAQKARNDRKARKSLSDRRKS